MIEFEEVLEIHETLIREFGGSKGLRDEFLLLSALKRPWSGFGDKEFYPSPEEKAAVLLESIVKNHPFVDGNKRTGYVLMRLMLLQYNLDIEATQEEKFQFIMSIASGAANTDEILNWIKLRLIKIT